LLSFFHRTVLLTLFKREYVFQDATQVELTRP